MGKNSPCDSARTACGSRDSFCCSGISILSSGVVERTTLQYPFPARGTSPGRPALRAGSALHPPRPGRPRRGAPFRAAAKPPSVEKMSKNGLLNTGAARGPAARKFWEKSEVSILGVLGTFAPTRGYLCSIRARPPADELPIGCAHGSKRERTRPGIAVKNETKRYPPLAA